MMRTQGDVNRTMRAARGFSLIELLFVIGIIVVLMSLIFPVFRSLREGNQLVSCNSRLMRIGQALHQYYLDETAVPPWYLDPETDPADTATVPIGTGLQGLMAAGYISDRNTFHCPRAVYVMQDDPAYYHSYDERDTEAEVGASDVYGLFNQYKYLSTRGVVEGEADYNRQLMPCATPTSGLPAPKPRPIGWYPDDSTVVTWCDYHADSYTKGGDGVYNVLYWDGSVILKPQSFMRDVSHTMAPDGAWRIDPKQ